MAANVQFIKVLVYIGIVNFNGQRSVRSRAAMPIGLRSKVTPCSC